VTINVDARGAAPGVERDIISAITAMEDHILNRAVNVVIDGMERGRF